MFAIFYKVFDNIHVAKQLVEIVDKYSYLVEKMAAVPEKIKLRLLMKMFSFLVIKFF